MHATILCGVNKIHLCSVLPRIFFFLRDSGRAGLTVGQEGGRNVYSNVETTNLLLLLLCSAFIFFVLWQTPWQRGERNRKRKKKMFEGRDGKSKQKQRERERRGKGGRNHENKIKGEKKSSRKGKKKRGKKGGEEKEKGMGKKGRKAGEKKLEDKQEVEKKGLIGKKFCQGSNPCRT